MTKFLRRTTVASVLFMAGAASAVAPAILNVDPTSSSISYTIVHKLHTVVGTSKKLEGKVAMQADGTVQVMVRAPIASFDSANSGRDEHMQETLEATRFPLVAFKGLAKITEPTTFPAKVTAQVTGELDFHGRKHTETIPVEITFTSATEAHATAKFDVSLDKYEVERPSLMLMKIEDNCRVALDLPFKRS